VPISGVQPPHGSGLELMRELSQDHPVAGTSPRIAVLAPMSSELAPLKRPLSLRPRTEGEGQVFRGTIGRVEIVALQTGIGPPLAARAAERVLALGGVERVVVVGIAGAVAPELALGELVVPERVVDLATGKAFHPTPIGGVKPRGTLATAAGIALLMAIGTREPSAGDSGPARRAVIIGDSVASVASALRDTLRIVQFILTAPAASRVALAGDFNDWNPRAMPLTRVSENGRWSVTLALAPGRHSYAYVVDDTQWVRDPAGTPAEPNDLTPPRSVVVVQK
jgi:nucleoside phosphorylase